MPSTKRPTLDGSTLRKRLAALRRRLRLVATVRGSGLLLTVVLAAAVVAGLLDWRWHLPDLVRAIVLVGTLAGGIVIAYRFLFRPLTAPSDDLSLALRVEEEYPALNDSLASTVQFLERGARSDSSSAALEREAVKRALVRAAGCDFGKVVNKRGVMWAGLSGGALTALATALMLLAPPLALTALLRLANPFGGHEWPKNTQLEIDAPRERIGRNEAFEVLGQVHGVIPPQATILFRFEGFPNLEYHCDIKTDANGVGRLAARLEPGRVQRNFRFQVRANDAVSPEYRVEVLPPPSLIAIDGKPSPQVELFYPAYTGLPSPDALSPGNGNIDAVAGTAARLRARADRPLKRAWIAYQPEQPSALLSMYLAPLGATDSFSAVLLLAGSKTWWPVEAALEQDRCTFAAHFAPMVNGMYELHIEDEVGLRNNRLFELRLYPDPAPTVNLERPAPSRDILTVLPTAELALEVIADDQQYAVRSVFVEYRTQRDEPARRLTLYEPATGPGRLLAMWAGPEILGAPRIHLRPQRLEFRQKLAVQSLRHADGTSLKEDDIVFLRAAADDFDDVTVNKEPGRSHEVEIRIVGRNALDLALNQEQANVQQELVRLREKEREALQKVNEVENRLKKGEKVTAEDEEKLLQAEQLQQQIRERVGTEKDGLRSELKRILETLEQNGMEKTAVQERMSDVSREMERLAENELQQIEPRLTNARKLAELLDEKAREERKAQLEARAEEADKEAKQAEEEAEKKQRAAAEEEKKAERSETEAERARHRREAERERQQAEELRQKARELRQQAEHDRRDATQTPDAAQPRRALAEARKGQEEVEKTLNDLLTRRLEPWTSSHEIKGEANKLLEEQRRLEAELEKMSADDQGFAGKKPDELNQRQRAELENAKEAQQKLEERTRQLLDKMDRVAKQREAKDPETARELREAWDQAQQDNISEKMKEAREQIEQNNFNEARNSQQQSIRDLKKLVKNLEDRREAELDRLAKKLREKERELAELVQEQEELQKKVKEAGQIGDKAKREEELKRLAKKQQELQKKTEEMVRQLTRMRASRAGQALSKAGEQMDGAGQQLDGGQKGEDEQDEALERLNEAQRELERARKEAEEELAREQISKLADLIRPLKERQEALNAETSRSQESVQRKGAWSRSFRADFLRKREAQRSLAEETKDLAAKRLTNAPVFARLMRRASEAMNEASERMEQVAMQPVEPAQLPDAETARLQQLAVRRLTQVVDALKEAAEKMQQAKGGGGGGGGGEGGAAGAAAQNDGIPPLAQLKLLRDLQKDINERTDTFKKQHPNLNKLEARDKNELNAIRKDQQDVAELIDELTRPAGEPDAAEGDKKK